MLILTRKERQAIKIGDDITVVVLDRKGNQTRIGIKAPESMEVHREEIYLKVQTSKEEKNGK